MKPSRYLSAAARSLSIPSEPAAKRTSECARCGWQFPADNEKFRAFSGKDPKRRRTEPRTEIHVSDNHGSMMVRCSTCYETELWHSGRHSNQGHDGASIYREALKL